MTMTIRKNKYYDRNGNEVVLTVEQQQHITKSKLDRKEYYQKHSVCPKCGEGCSQTYVGYVGEDKNSAWCECGWKGIVDNLVQKQI